MKPSPSDDARIRRLVQTNKFLRGLSLTDELTGLWNLRYFREQLEIEYARSSRYRRPFSLIFVDVDDFKSFNDQNGHPAGDLLLRELALILKLNCRKSDVAFRYGGEEFVILCPEINATKAVVMGERIREVVETYPFDEVEKQPKGFLSVSVGIAAYPIHAESIEDLVKQADRALYRSKDKGKNCVTLANPKAKASEPRSPRSPRGRP